MRRLVRCALGFAVCASLGSAAGAARGADVVIRIAADASELEQFAAAECAGQLSRLFDVSTSTDPNESPAQGWVLIGNPQRHPAIAQSGGAAWPQLSAQGFVLRAGTFEGKPAWIVGADSAAAALWGVYELGHQFGIRYLPREDIFPDVKPMRWDGVGQTFEPEFTTRSWQTIDALAMGPAAWPLREHQRMLRQLAKMKFNHLALAIHPWQPFVQYSANGVEKRTGVLWFGEKFAIARDAPGRTALGGVSVFENPDFAGAATYAERTAAGVELLRGLIEQGQRLGMRVAISISPLEFPPEFAEALSAENRARTVNDLLRAPGRRQKLDDSKLQSLVAAKISACLATYPTIDELDLALPELLDWEGPAEEAWGQLTAEWKEAPLLASLERAAEQRALPANGERGRAALRGNLVALAFLRQLLAERPELLRRSDGKSIRLSISGVDPELFPWLSKLLPANAGTLNFGDATARQVDENRDYLKRVASGDAASSRLMLALADDRVGILSQSSARRVERLVDEIRERGWEGFCARGSMLAELDPAVHYLSRAAWDSKATAHSTHDELFAAVTGKQAAADRLWLAFGHIEQATELIDQQQSEFARPAPGMLLQHYQDQPAPEWWTPLNEHYTQAMIELYRSHDAAHPRSRRRLFYWAKRSEYVLEYLAAVKGIRESAQAKDTDEALEKMEGAIEQLYNSIDTLADIAQDQGDRGLIAVLNAYAYRPLMQQYEKLAQ